MTCKVCITDYDTPGEYDNCNCIESAFYSKGGESKIVEAKPVHARIKGELVIENNISVFKIISVPEYNQYSKLECKVECNDNGKTEGLWQLNGQSTNALIVKFGKETLQWVNNSVPITTKKFESGIGIMVDTAKLEGIIA